MSVIFAENIKWALSETENIKLDVGDKIELQLKCLVATIKK